MIVIGRRYFYKGQEVIVDDGDRLEQTWTVTVVATGRQVMGVSTSELKTEKDNA